jgi:hypoxanthine phosphoribosyltransferase
MNRTAAATVTEALTGGTMKILMSEQTIERRVDKLAAQISRDYSDKELVLIAILKGAQIFACDLVRKLTIPSLLDFMSISRYKRTPDVKEVEVTKDLSIDISGRHLLIVEDIVDTGFTLDYLIRQLEERNPASIAICSLLDRPALRLAEIPVRYVGFNVSEEFLVGYGLDYREQYRDLPFIAAIEI